MVTINTLFAAITLLAILWSLWLAILIIKDIKKWMAKTNRQKSDDDIYNRYLDRATHLQREQYHFDIYTGVWSHNMYPDFIMSDHDVLVKDELPHLPTDHDFDELFRYGHDPIKPEEHPTFQFMPNRCPEFTPILKVVEGGTPKTTDTCLYCGLTEDKH